MVNEFEAITRNNTWHLVPYHEGQKVVESKWVYKTKFKANGEVERFKARLVAKGFQQEPRISFNNTFSPVTKMTTLRLILALATSLIGQLNSLTSITRF